MANHHADSCYFLLKLRQSLSYLGIDPDAAFKKKRNFKGKQSYEKNCAFVRSRMQANFIPFPQADADLFIDVVDGDHEVFTPDIINQVNDRNNNNQKEE